MTLQAITLIMGLIILIKSADVMVDAASKIAKILKVPGYIIGLLVVSTGTSMPETAIGIFAGIEKANLITLGNVIGANTYNITMVLGITALIFPLEVDSQVPRKQLSLYIGIEMALVFMLYSAGTLSRLESALMTIGMIVFIIYIVHKTKKLTENEAPETMLEGQIFEYIEKHEAIGDHLSEMPKPHYLLNEKGKRESTLKLSFFLIMGLSGLILGANLTLRNAVIIAETIGWSQEVIGITVVSFGTCLPELTASLIAAMKKEEGIAVGNIVGSCIYNILFVLGISGMLHPIRINGTELFFDLSVMIGASVLLMIPTFLHGKISRITAAIYIVYYFLYLFIKLTHSGGS